MPLRMSSQHLAPPSWLETDAPLAMEMEKSSARELLEITMMEHSAPGEEALPISALPE
jgi:hypothetical protein